MRSSSGIVVCALLAAGTLPAATPASAQTDEVRTDPSALRAAAETIDPLAQAAEAEAAWEAYLKALEATVGSVTEQALALNRMGDSRYYQQDFRGALEASLEAMRRLEAAGQDNGEPMAETLANVAVFYGVNGQPDKELPLQERAFAIRKELYGTDPMVLDAPAAKSLGLGYLNYATVLYERGRFAEAAGLVRPAIDGLIRGEMRDATLFVAMSSGANMLVDGGRPVDALELAERGVALATELLPEDHPFIGFAHATLAKVLLQSDRYEEAEAPARRALDIMAEKLGPEHRNTLTAMHNLGMVSYKLGRYDEAIELIMGRYEVVVRENPGEAVLSLLGASDAAHEAGKAEIAWELGSRARDLAETLPESDRKASSGLLTYAHRLEERGDFAGAREQVERVVARAEASGLAVEPALAIRRGLLAIRTGETEAGWAMTQAGAAGLREDMLEDANRFELGADLPSYYEAIMQVVEAAMVSGRPDDALRAFELASWGVNARARQLLALRETVGADATAAADVDALHEGRERLRVLYRERSALLASDQPAAAEERAAEIAQLLGKVEQAGARLQAAVPDLARWLHPAQVGVAEIQARLEADEALLVVMPSRNHVFSMAITRDGVAMEQADKGRPELRALVAELRGALEGEGGASAAFPVAAAVALHDLVMPGRVGALLAGRPRVAVVTSDALSRLPFGVLLPQVPAVDQRDYREMDWLARSHAFSIALTPSLAFSDRGESAPRSSFLGVGAPQLRGATDAPLDGAALFRGAQVSLDDVRGLPALPATAAEVAEVAQALASERSVSLVGADATEPRVRQEGRGGHGVVLFATHGLLGGEIGGLREPALVLTPPVSASGSQNDGLLQASEIAALGIEADFVILSACNSAAGRNMTAPAYTGLANAFLGSGTKSLMLSHWRVRDDAAAFLSSTTVRGATGDLDRAEALRRAQLALIDSELPDAANPAVWAPFVLVEN
jgi:CHAT domain-containing protein/tetratricopeptide (TPR) repeat protein